MKQKYHLSGNIGYQPFRNLFLTAGADGDFVKAYANSDPRPEISNFRYEVFAKLGYQFGKHRFFGKLSYLNRRKESDITYNNIDLNSPANFEYYIRFNRGYGNTYYNAGFGDNYYLYDGINYAGEYNFVSKNSYFRLGYENQYYIDRFWYQYSYQARDENNDLKYYRNEIKISGLKTEKNKIFAHYFGHLFSGKLNSYLELSDQKDQNYDYQNLNTSYRVFNSEINWQNYWSHYNQKNELLRMGLYLKYGNQDIKDISVVLHKKLQFLYYNLEVEKEIRLQSEQKLSAKISQSLYLPLQNQISFQPYQGSQNNFFVSNIIMPDYVFDYSTQLGLSLKVKYMLDLNKIRYEFFGEAGQLYFVKAGNSEHENLINKNSNTALRFGVNFIY